MCLCLDSFPEEQTKITWALSYMKSGQAAKWAEQIFYWEEKNPRYSKFLDWDEFQNEFRKDFCPAHSSVAGGLLTEPQVSLGTELTELGELGTE